MTVEEVVSKGKRRLGLETPSAADADGNVGIVRGALRAFGEGDHDAFLDTLHDDVAWEAPDKGRFPGGGTQSGCDAVRENFIGDASRTYTKFGFRPESYLDADDEDAVVVMGRFIGEGVQGDKLDTEGVQVWEFQGNSAVRVRTIADSAAFPEVVTERQQEKWREEDKEAEEREKREEQEKDSDDDDEPKSESKDEEPKSESKDDESERKDDSDEKD
jgi:ketosteroid isomerase-like protein